MYPYHVWLEVGLEEAQIGLICQKHGLANDASSSLIEAWDDTAWILLVLVY